MRKLIVMLPPLISDPLISVLPEFHGDDNLDGGLGDDQIVGDGGNDVLEGGTGVRVLRFKCEAANDAEGRMAA